jgi:predicted 3-demethylubiquinone-9 3-methyltransferase (glyoxalase superfamily)
MQKITTFLMFDYRAHEAMKFYTSVFKNSRIVSTMGPEGNVMGGTFEIDGQQFFTYNGGPHFSFTEGISLYVDAPTQDEIDYYWNKLSDGGEKSMCGWVKDKFGVWWQIVPPILGELLSDKDPARAQRAVQAMLQMKKLDIQALKDAADGK